MLLILIACENPDSAKDSDSGVTDTEETGETADTQETDETADTQETAETADTSDTSDSGETADTGDDTGDDTDTDVDTDSGPDTDTAVETGDTADSEDTWVVDTGDDTADTADTADTSVDLCSTGTEADLVFSVEIQDSSGACTTCASGDVLSIYGVVENPCETDLSFETRSGCLFSQLDIIDYSSGVGMSSVWECTSVITTWTVPAMDRIDVAEAWGRQDPGMYEVTIHFDDMAWTTATSLIDVL